MGSGQLTLHCWGVHTTHSADFKCTGSAASLGVNPISAKDLLGGPRPFTQQLGDAFAHLSNWNVNNIHRHVERFILVSIKLLGPLLVVAQ